MGPSASTTTTALLSITAIALVAWKARLSKERRRLPPGPPADPLIGHIRLIPPEGQDIFFYELGKKYGDVVQLRILGQSMIILNSVEAAIDLLDKRSAIYSDRPDLPIFELQVTVSPQSIAQFIHFSFDSLGIADTLVFEKYGKEFRHQRRMIQQYFTNNKRAEHHPIQTREARVLSEKLLSAPEDWFNSLVRFTTAVIIEIGYGHQITSDEDPYLKIAEECCHIAKFLGPPGATPVDLFPFLRYFPSWFPGTHYATFARNSYAAYRKLREYPYEQMLKQMGKGAARPSFLLSQLEGLDQKAPDAAATINLVQAASTILFVAGADTVGQNSQREQYTE
ncbi:hypothetical protein H0H87_000547 [Tephrocybe sp. NHM501043]|nr:hypothetical protein H0H87_000547 [Tephrocybe sp. NHM501043]